MNLQKINVSKFSTGTRIFQVDIEDNNGVPLSQIQRLFLNASVLGYSEDDDRIVW